MVVPVHAESMFGGLICSMTSPRMHCTEIDAVTRCVGGVRHGRMHLGSREHIDATYIAYRAYLRVEFHWFFGMRLHAGVGLHVLSGVLAAVEVPLVVIVLARAISNRLIPIARM